MHYGSGGGTLLGHECILSCQFFSLLGGRASEEEEQEGL